MPCCRWSLLLHKTPQYPSAVGTCVAMTFFAILFIFIAFLFSSTTVHTSRVEVCVCVCVSLSVSNIRSHARTHAFNSIWNTMIEVGTWSKSMEKNRTYNSIFGLCALCFAHLLFIGNGYFETQWLCCVRWMCVRVDMHKNQIASPASILKTWFCWSPRHLLHCFIMVKSYWNCIKSTTFTIKMPQNWNGDQIEGEAMESIVASELS